ncbi:unnamed protein product [Rhizophagus irregularis]|uniref:Palmitoyltransferase n=1 Tax=Rhizophagus irregularis TaxID=588596 RepID=A0A2I1GS99_9GLOM|nr:zf-DHHC-domain-containing protein [Rhizophagus irregularis]CAB4431732.1 unnamed protein product [Rhizophagus irregularis]
MYSLTIFVGRFMPVVVLSLVGYTYYVFVFRICVNRLIDYDKIAQAVIYLVIYNILFVMTLLSYFRILLQGPGSPSKSPKQSEQQRNSHSPDDDVTVNVSQPTTFTIHHFNPVTNPINTSNADALLQMENAFIKDSVSPTVAASTSNTNAATSNPSSSSIMVSMPNIFISKRDGRLRWCDRCNYVKPDRCHHCSECDTCVLKMDHHCPWVNGCVGYFNYKCFYLFIVYTSLYADFAFAATIPVLVEQLKEDKYLDIQLIIIMIFGFIFGLLLTGFTLVHTTYVLRNRTTIESISFRTRTYNVRVQFDVENPLGYGVTTTQPGENLWNLGWKKNWKDVMGNKWWLWFIPFGKPPGDGLIYSFNPDLRTRLIDDAKRQSQAQEDRMAMMMQQAQRSNTRGGTGGGRIL